MSKSETNPNTKRKSKIRNSKSETNRNTKIQTGANGRVLGICLFVIRICFGFRISVFGFLLLLSPHPVDAQLLGQTSSQFELADTVQLDRADSGVLQQLERVKAYVAEHQWDEAVESLRQLMENSDGKLLAVSEHRYVSVADYCQMQLAALPPEALKLYRAQDRPGGAEVVRGGRGAARPQTAGQRVAPGLRE